MAKILCRGLAALLLVMCVSCGPQFDTWINNIIQEKGIDQYAGVGEDINVNDYHFPKKGPVRPRVYVPKTHKNRYRNYKQRPENPMIHTLKTPSRPMSCIATADLEKGKKYDGIVRLHWLPPQKDGGAEITTYWVSKDAGFTWYDVGMTNSTLIEGLSLNEPHDLKVRAVNKVGAGDWYSLAFDNTIPHHLRERTKTTSLYKTPGTFWKGVPMNLPLQNCDGDIDRGAGEDRKACLDAGEKGNEIVEQSVEEA